MARFIALTELHLGDGKVVAEGESVELDPDVALPLLEVGGIAHATGQSSQLQPFSAPLAAAIDALRTAETGEIRAFFKAVGEDPELQERIEHAMDETAQAFIAIGNLDPDNPEHFTQSGAPRTDTLEALLDRPVSSDQRDAWWEDYQEAQKKENGE